MKWIHGYEKKFAIRVLAVLSFVLLVLLSSGCLVTSGPAPTNTTISPSPSLNNTYWLAVDPLPDHHPGDLINVTGTTNLPQNDELTVEVFNYEFYPGQCGPNKQCPYSSFVNTTKVFPAATGNNTFACTVNTSGFYPVKFRVRVISARYDVMGESSFTLEP